MDWEGFWDGHDWLEFIQRSRIVYAAWPLVLRYWIVSPARALPSTRGSDPGTHSVPGGWAGDDAPKKEKVMGQEEG